MTIEEVLEAKPHAKELLFEYGLFSENASVQSMETLAEAANAHNMPKDKLKELVSLLEAL